MKILSDEVELSNDILKVLVANKFTLEEMELVFTLVRYRLTGKLIFPNDYIEQQWLDYTKAVAAD